MSSLLVYTGVSKHEAVGASAKVAIERNELQALTLQRLFIHPDSAVEGLLYGRAEELEQQHSPSQTSRGKAMAIQTDKWISL